MDSLFTMGYDERTGIGFYLLLISSVDDFEVNEEKVVVFLPDGKLLTRNTAARRDIGSGNVHAAHGLRYTCTEPFRRWEIDYSGSVQEHSSLQSTRGALPNGPQRLLDFHFDLNMQTPAWILGGTSHESANFRRHYQQQLTFRGSLAYAGQTFELAGSGHRNHSRGARTFARQQSVEYLYLLFPSGRSFGLYNFTYADSPPVTTAYSVVDGVLEDATVEEVTPLGSLVLRDEPISIRLLTTRGPVTLAGTTVHSLATTKIPPRHFVLGLDRAPEDGMLLWETIVRIELDGETAYGLYSRARPLADLSDTALPHDD